MSNQQYQRQDHRYLRNLKKEKEKKRQLPSDPSLFVIGCLFDICLTRGVLLFVALHACNCRAPHFQILIGWWDPHRRKKIKMRISIKAIRGRRSVGFGFGVYSGNGVSGMGTKVSEPTTFNQKKV